jgi:hypothetical protein
MADVTFPASQGELRGYLALPARWAGAGRVLSSGPFRPSSGGGPGHARAQVEAE